MNNCEFPISPECWLKLSSFHLGDIGQHFATKTTSINRSVMLHPSSINRRHSTSNPLLIGNICKLVPIEKWAKPWYWNHYYYYYYTQMSLAVGGWLRMNGERAERSSVGPLKKWIEKWNNISEIPRLRSILPGYSSQLVLYCCCRTDGAWLW